MGSKKKTKKVRRKPVGKEAPRKKGYFASYSAGELFMAALGAAILILFVALIVTALAGG